MSATASGANARPNGTTNSRDHNQGNQDRKWTVEQRAEVIRVRKCTPTAFYEILALKKTASDNDIKKSYRKLSLLTHPDKNGYEGADEAFKMVSRAFQILSDVDKKSRYDQFGGDPDNRFSAGGGGTSSPFGGGFARAPGRAGGMYEGEMSPEDLFNQFFGGGGGAGFPFGGMAGGGFGGPQFVFNMGGGPGFTVHTMGGNRPRRRPRDATGQEQAPPSGLTALTQLLPLLLLFLLPLLSSLFSSSSSSGPSLRFDSPVPPLTLHRITPKYKIDYFVNPADVENYKARQFHSLDQRAEVTYIDNLRYQCDLESQRRRNAIQDATGLFWTDPEELKAARNMPMEACKRMDELRISRQY